MQVAVGPNETGRKMRIAIGSRDVRRARGVQAALDAAGAPAFVRQGEAGPCADILIECDPVPVLGADAGALATLAIAPFAEPAIGCGWADGVLQSDGSPALLARELKEAYRAGLARRELTLRRLTTRDQRPGFSAPSPLRTLFVGEPHALYLALERAHVERGARLDAALTSFMGFDALHDESFDGVVLNASGDCAMALSICGALRRNTRLHNVPTAVLTAPGDEDAAEAAVTRGASLVAASNAPVDRIAAWLFAKVAAGRKRTDVDAELMRLGAAFAGRCDGERIEEHLERLADDAHRAARPLSLACLRLELALGARRPSAAAWRRSIGAMGDLAAKLVRSYDTCALLDDGLVLVAFPGADAENAKIAAARIAAVAECTSFSADAGEAGPFLVENRVAELAPGESARALLARVVSPFGGGAAKRKYR